MRLAAAGKNLRPVFIVGEARSGTSLLYRLIQQQPAFGPNPPRLSESSFMPLLMTPGTLRGKSARSWQMRSYMAEDEAAWRRFESAAAPWLAIRRVVLRVAPSVYRQPTIGRVLGAARIARIYLAVAAEVRGATRLVEKTPSAAQYTGHLLDWFPGSRALYIHRHPVDVITSYWRRATVDRPEWASLTVEEFADRYATRTAEALAWAERRPDAVRLLRYDDFVTEPEASVKAICDFAGCDFDPAFINVSANRGVYAHTKLWEDPIAETKHWGDYITDEQVKQLEDRLISELDQLGYERRSRA